MGRKKENFTSERISSYRCEPEKQQSIYWDAKTPGLGLRVTSTGAKSYIFEARLHGRTLRTTIGDVRTWTIGEVQAEARRLKTLTDQGLDPRQQAAQLKAKADADKIEARRQTLTLGEAWPAYLEARKAKWSERHYQDHLKLAAEGGKKKKRGKGATTPGPLASLMTTPLYQLTSDKLASWLETESTKRPTNTAQSYRLLRAFIRWAADSPEYAGIVTPEAFKSRTVKDAIPKNQPKEGDCLEREQLKPWFDAVHQLPNPVISTYLQGLLLTGARREELGSLTWQDVDFQWNRLTIRDKVDGQRVIPLPPYLANLLFNLPRRNKWVFSSPTAAEGRLAEPRIAHNRALETAGLPHLSLHGLRRSFGTLSEWVEAPTGIVAQIMGHKPSALAEKHYRRRPLDLLRMWHEKIEAWILEQGAIEFKAEEATPGLSVVKP